jgi:hypothetical protein
MTELLSVRGVTAAALQRGAIKPFKGSLKTLAHAVIGNFSTVGLRPVMLKVRDLRPSPGPTPGPTPSPSPTIQVSFSGSMTDAEFHVTGSGFLPDLPGTRTSSVAIRVVDANALIETRREFVPSNHERKIDHVVKGDISGLVVNAAGQAFIAFSATDGRPGPGVDGFLFSNTVRIQFP